MVVAMKRSALRVETAQASEARLWRQERHQIVEGQSR